MLIEYMESEFDIPDYLIEKYIKDFDGLAGSGNRESVLQLRESAWDVLDFVAEDPEMVHEPEVLRDFVKALAVRQALQYHGVLFDA